MAVIAHIVESAHAAGTLSNQSHVLAFIHPPPPPPPRPSSDALPVSGHPGQAGRGHGCNTPRSEGPPRAENSGMQSHPIMAHWGGPVCCHCPSRCSGGPGHYKCL